MGRLQEMDDGASWLNRPAKDSVREFLVWLVGLWADLHPGEKVRYLGLPQREALFERMMLSSLGDKVESMYLVDYDREVISSAITSIVDSHADMKTHLRWKAGDINQCGVGEKFSFIWADYCQTLNTHVDGIKALSSRVCDGGIFAITGCPRGGGISGGINRLNFVRDALRDGSGRSFGGLAIPYRDVGHGCMTTYVFVETRRSRFAIAETPKGKPYSERREDWKQILDWKELLTPRS